MSLISVQDIQQIIQNSGLWRSPISEPVMDVLGLNKFNKLYYETCTRDGIQGIDALFDQLNISVSVLEKELRNIPKEGAFVLVSNHPFGILDGLALIKVIGSVRPDLKVFAEHFLLRFRSLHHFFTHTATIPVSKKERNKCFQDGLNVVDKGVPFAFFPSEEVSTFQDTLSNVSDKKWRKNWLKKVKAKGVPILPVYFKGENSKLYHFAGKINSNLQSVLLPRELLKKENFELQMRIGKPIQKEEQDSFLEIEQFSKFLRMKTYGLGSALEVRKLFLPSLSSLRKPAEIVKPIAKDILSKEVDLLEESSFVHRQGDFELYLAPALKIPNILTEIGRLREVTFRAVGEGSNRKLDLDEFDLYYDHLFIWDRAHSAVAGAYRIGYGDKILREYGKKGLYTSGLFKMGQGLKPILKQSVELGRSFVAPEYQARPMPLFLLWQGILMFFLRNQQYRYMIGPVSISNSYSELSKSLLIAFIKEYCFDDDLAAQVRARKAYDVKFENEGLEVLYRSNSQKEPNINQLDKIIEELEPAGYKVPVLLKKYLMLNAKIIGFNIDPKFNNSLDGLMILDFTKVPKTTIEKLKRALVLI